MTKKSQEQFENSKYRCWDKLIICCVCSILFGMLLAIFLHPILTVDNQNSQKSQSFQCLEEKNVTTFIGSIFITTPTGHPSQNSGSDCKSCGEFKEENYTKSICTLQCAPDKKVCQWLEDSKVKKEGKDCRNANLDDYMDEQGMNFYLGREESVIDWCSRHNGFLLVDATCNGYVVCSQYEEMA